MHKKKILVISPIQEFGGRELETGFISSILDEKYDVKVLSTSGFYVNSQVKTFGNNFYYTSINEELFREKNIIRFVLKFVCFFFKKISFSSNSLSNPFFKKKFNIESKKAKYLEKEIPKYDLIIICAQIFSNYLEKIIDTCYTKNIPVVFRTTGTIYEDIKKLKFKWISKVNLFIHNSERNARQLFLFEKVEYRVIDQCAFIEKDLLALPIEYKGGNFFVLSRLSPEKQVDKVIKAFKEICDESDFLYIFGSGPEMNTLKMLAKDNKNIIFKGHISHKEVVKAFSYNDCLIISSLEEAGPLTGVEAMAAAKLIISTKVGAMPERLIDYQFWYDGSQKELSERMRAVKALPYNEIIKIERKLRENYLKSYSVKSISQQYLNCFESFLKNK